MSDTRWEGFSHDEIYARVQQGPGRAASFDAEAAWTTVGSTIRSVDEQLTRAVEQIGAEWQGAAGDGVRGGMRLMSNWALDAAVDADLTSAGVAAQAEQAGFVRTAMPPPRTAEWNRTVNEVVPGLGLMSAANDLGALEEHMANDRARAVELMNQYSSRSGENQQLMNYWTQPPTVVVETVAPGSSPPGAVGVLPSPLGATAAALPLGRASTVGGSAAGSAPPVAGVHPGPGAGGTARAGDGAGPGAAANGREPPGARPGPGLPPPADGGVPNGGLGGPLPPAVVDGATGPSRESARGPGAAGGPRRPGSVATSGSGPGPTTTGRSPLLRDGEVRPLVPGPSPRPDAAYRDPPGRAPGEVGLYGGKPRASGPLPDGVIGRTAPAEPAAPAERVAGRPSGTAGHGLLPMGGVPRPPDREHRRPDYLLDDTDAFADDRIFTPPVIGGDEPEAVHA